MNKCFVLFLAFIFGVNAVAFGVAKHIKVTPFTIDDTLKLELVASFNFGSPGDCPQITAFDTTLVNDTIKLNVYYDISGIWAANFCQNIDTIDIGIVTANFKQIHVEMYTTSHSQSTGITDTMNRPPTWFVFLPLDITLYEQRNAIGISPNPNNGQFVLHGDLSGVSKLDIVDITGRVVYADNIPVRVGRLKKEIDIGDAPPGLYMLRLYTEKGVHVRKLLVE